MTIRSVLKLPKIVWPSPFNQAANKNTWHTHVTPAVQDGVGGRNSDVTEVTWECHVFLLDASLTKLNSILTMDAKNIKHVWFFPHGLARPISHQKFPAHGEKTAEQTVSRGSLLSSFLTVCGGLYIRSSCQTLFSNFFGLSSFLWLPLLYNGSHSVATAVSYVIERLSADNHSLVVDSFRRWRNLIASRPDHLK